MTEPASALPLARLGRIAAGLPDPPTIPWPVLAWLPSLAAPGRVSRRTAARAPGGSSSPAAPAPAPPPPSQPITGSAGRRPRARPPRAASARPWPSRRRESRASAEPGAGAERRSPGRTTTRSVSRPGRPARPPLLRSPALRSSARPRHRSRFASAIQAACSLCRSSGPHVDRRRPALRSSDLARLGRRGRRRRRRRRERRTRSRLRGASKSLSRQRCRGGEAVETPGGVQGRGSAIRRTRERERECCIKYTHRGDSGFEEMRGETSAFCASVSSSGSGRQMRHVESPQEARDASRKMRAVEKVLQTRTRTIIHERTRSRPGGGRPNRCRGPILLAPAFRTECGERACAHVLSTQTPARLPARSSPHPGITSPPTPPSPPPRLPAATRQGPPPPRARGGGSGSGATAGACAAACGGGVRAYWQSGCCWEGRGGVDWGGESVTESPPSTSEGDGWRTPGGRRVGPRSDRLGLLKGGWGVGRGGRRWPPRRPCGRRRRSCSAAFTAAGAARPLHLARWTRRRPPAAERAPHPLPPPAWGLFRLVGPAPRASILAQ